MKLRNKKTGEFRNYMLYNLSSEKFEVFDTADSKNAFQYDSLAKLCEEWEDYEADKPWKPQFGEKYWFVRNDGKILDSKWDGYEIDEYRYSVGNCFRTKEEAEQAVEKLKAWKRLKDAGFKFVEWDLNGEIDFEFSDPNHIWPQKRIEDLNLLFGGDDEEV